MVWPIMDGAAAVEVCHVRARSGVRQRVRGVIRIEGILLNPRPNPVVTAFVLPARRKPRRTGQPFLVIGQGWASPRLEFPTMPLRYFFAVGGSSPLRRRYMAAA